MFTGYPERLPNEDCICARCIYKQLAINTQRAIDNECGDVSGIWIPLDSYSSGLAYFGTEPRRHRLEKSSIGKRLQVIPVVSAAKCRRGRIGAQHPSIVCGHGSQAEILQWGIETVPNGPQPTGIECAALNRCPIRSPGMEEPSTRSGHEILAE